MPNDTDDLEPGVIARAAHAAFVVFTAREQTSKGMRTFPRAFNVRLISRIDPASPTSTFIAVAGEDACEVVCTFDEVLASIEPVSEIEDHRVLGAHYR